MDRRDGRGKCDDRGAVRLTFTRVWVDLGLMSKIGHMLVSVAGVVTGRQIEMSADVRQGFRSGLKRVAGIDGDRFFRLPAIEAVEIYCSFAQDLRILEPNGPLSAGLPRPIIPVARALRWVLEIDALALFGRPATAVPDFGRDVLQGRL